MEAIKPTDLRIGNYIIWEDDSKEIIQVTGIYEDEEIGWVVKFKDGGAQLNEFIPIPLTEEIIVKAGFEFDKLDKCYKSFPCFEVQIIADVFEGNASAMLYTRTVHTDYKPIYKVIDTIHGLQNLFYSLTGTELKIQL